MSPMYCRVFYAVSAKDSPVTDRTRSFYSRSGSTLEDALMLHLQQTYSSSLRYVVSNCTLSCFEGFQMMLSDLLFLQTVSFSLHLCILLLLAFIVTD